MPISKRLRYEILERDGHTCQSCGRTPPEVQLTVDHVVPSALGGADKASNAQVLCRDCNAGKSSRQPDAAHIAAVDADAARWADAMKRAAEVQRQDVERDHRFVHAFNEQWCYWTCGNDEPLERPDAWEQSVLSMRDAGLDLDALREAVRVAMAAKQVKNRDTFRYFCGVAWKALQRRQQTARELLTPPVQQDHEGDEIEPSWMDAYSDIHDYAEQLERPGVEFWMLDEMQDGIVLHRPLTGCVRLTYLVWALFEGCVSGHSAQSAIDNVRKTDDKKFCSWCCPDEAKQYNAAPVDGVSD